MSEVRTYLQALMAVDDAPLKLDPGQVIFSAGEPGRAMFIVRTGTVDCVTSCLATLPSRWLRSARCLFFSFIRAKGFSFVIKFYYRTMAFRHTTRPYNPEWSWPPWQTPN